MGLLNAIKRNENIRKLFGKKELIIIEKQLLGIKLKPSEKIRLSRDIRKKFDAVKELSPFVNEFEIKHGAVIKEIIQNTKEVILDSQYFQKIKKIYLFGSTAEKSHIFRSDIDIAVEFDKITDKEATKFRIDISGKANNKVDIQVYNILPEKIKEEINEKGKLIYERKN
jgi:predicted nucleotidyltransferase